MPVDKYILGRGYVPAARLNFQHYQWKEALGYNLHPSAAADNISHAIADVGTGTGIWLADISRTVPPTTTLDGFDVPSAQFTHHSHLPSNVHLYEVDALKDAPSEYRGSYDVVHLRLLQSVVDNDDPSAIVRHCHQLLKPGGILQWEEHDAHDQTMPQPEAGVMACLEALGSYTKNVKLCTWVTRLPTILSQLGFEPMTCERKREQPWQLQMINETICMLAEEVASTHLDLRDPSGQEGDTVRDLARGAYTEIARGGAISQVYQCCVARKV